MERLKVSLLFAFEPSPEDFCGSKFVGRILETDAQSRADDGKIWNVCPYACHDELSSSI